MIHPNQYLHQLQSRKNHHAYKNVLKSLRTTELEDDPCLSRQYFLLLGELFEIRSDDDFVQDNLHNEEIHNGDDIGREASKNLIADAILSKLSKEQKQNIAPCNCNSRRHSYGGERWQSQRVTLRDITAEVYRKQFKEEMAVNVSQYLRRYTSWPVEESSRSRMSIRSKLL